MANPLDVLAGFIADTGPDPGAFRVAKITATAPLSIQFGSLSAITNVKRLSSYSPVTNHMVLVLTRGNEVIVLGQIL